jgi:hypothetical protein
MWAEWIPGKKKKKRTVSNKERRKQRSSAPVKVIKSSWKPSHPSSNDNLIWGHDEPREFGPAQGGLPGSGKRK